MGGSDYTTTTGSLIFEKPYMLLQLFIRFFFIASGRTQRKLRNISDKDYVLRSTTSELSVGFSKTCEIW